MKNKILGLLAVGLLAGPMVAHAGLIEFTQQFDGGFNVSINGGGVAPSGPITIVGVVDDTAADIGTPGRGEFVLSSVTFTGAGFVNQSVITPLSVLVWGPDRFAFQLVGQSNMGITGWNGGSSAGNFIGNPNDLTTLLAPTYTTTGASTFWYDGLGAQAWLLGSGDTIGANLGSSGPDGVFSVRRLESVPEPGTLALLGLGLAGLGLSRRRKAA